MLNAVIAIMCPLIVILCSHNLSLKLITTCGCVVQLTEHWFLVGMTYVYEITYVCT